MQPGKEWGVGRYTDEVLRVQEYKNKPSAVYGCGGLVFWDSGEKS
jgi:hypothetical protein